MGKRYLIDTNILIDAQTGKLPEKGLSVLLNIINEDFTISFVSYIEFLGYKFATISMEEFINLSTVIETSKPIIEKTIELRKSGRIQFPDALIAATAIVHQRILITRNLRDFQSISGLQVLNLWDS